MSDLLIRKAEALEDSAIRGWLQALRGRPHVPVSRFDVTCVLKARCGDAHWFFGGVNVEALDTRLGNCAEEAAIAAMVTALGPQAEVIEGWVMAAPTGMAPGDPDPRGDVAVPCCGNCRQRLHGVAAPGVVIHSIALNGREQRFTVGEMLPGAFSFRNLASAEAARTGGSPPPDLAGARARLVRPAFRLTEPSARDWLGDLDGIDAASGTSQAVALQLANGDAIAGVSVEDAAYKGTSAMQAALAMACIACETVEVRAAFALTRSGDRLLAPRPLALSAIQLLAEFGAAPACPITLLGSGGAATRLTLAEAAATIATASNPQGGLNPA